MVSVIIRATLVQLRTPDEMRGRVMAVDMVFIGTSNELGQFESGLTAQWFGTVPAVVLGGVGTLVVIGLWSWMFPELRRTGELNATNTGVHRRLQKLRRKCVSRPMQNTTTGAKAGRNSGSLRGAEAPLFHGTACAALSAT